jgi:alkylation response protein AidB-like acyl-CoA dehydrogenase
MSVLSDEQAMLEAAAREWAARESPVQAFRRMRDVAMVDGFDPQAVAAQAEMGWFGITVPEAYGGSAFGFLSLGLVLEQLGRNLGRDAARFKRGGG